jgi:formylglycine-generating enzyme required for sulfatase activity
MNTQEPKIEMITCPPGSFWMGNDEDHSNALWHSYSTPKHEVQITQPFEIAQTPVTQAFWDSIMAWNPSAFKNKPNHPIENVSWYDSIEFCNILSEKEGLEKCYHFDQIQRKGKQIIKANVIWMPRANGYRLPTEAEWEYAAKANQNFSYSGSNDLDEVAWYYENSKVNGANMTHEVKTKKPNAWGLYDMTGNILEWCHDAWHTSAYENREPTQNPVFWQNTPCAHILKGGSYLLDSYFCRITVRLWNEAHIKYANRGLRLLRSISMMHEN